MAGMTMLKGKYKYMPLSEANVKPVMVAAFDGQNIYVPGAASSFSTSSSAFSSSSFPSPTIASAEPKLDARYSMGNYLGGGIAGVVNEAYDKLHQRHVAIKMLNPVGHKLSTPSVLRRADIIKKGVPFLTGHNLRSMTRDHVYWVKLPAKRELVACYVDARGTTTATTNSMAAVTPQMLKELTLEMCVALWGLDADEDDDNDNDDAMNGSRRPVSDDSVPSSSSSSMTSSSSNTSSLSSSSSTSSSSSRELHHSMGGLREEMKGLTSSSDGSGDLPMGNDDEELMMTLMMSRDSCDDDEMLFPQQHRHEHVTVGELVYTIPSLPAKFRAFLQSRKSIYREIAHMHKLTGNSVSGQVAHGGHDNVLKLYDVLEYIQPSKSTIFLVLELASGGELFDRIRSDNGVDERVARGYFTQLLAGVLFCHQLGIVHRDLKPENLLLSDADVLKIADFGLSAHFIAAVSSGGSGAGVSASAEDDGRSLYSGAAMLPELDDDQDSLGIDSTNGSSSSGNSMLLPAARFRRLNSIVGSPHYVAPEVLQNARYGYDGRKADMWSVGVILYGLLAGSLPFGKELPTCPRYLKFCEWIRSLPCDPQTGKLVFDVSIYQPTPPHARIPSSSISNSSDASMNTNTTDDALPMTTTTFRIAQVHPNNCQPLSSSSSSSSSRWLQQTPPLPPVKPSDMGPSSSSSSTLANGASSGRRGSRVVAFPSWLFPSKLSPNAVFLLASLLHPEPGKRASCEETCRSTWVADVSL